MQPNGQNQDDTKQEDTLGTPSVTPREENIMAPGAPAVPDDDQASVDDSTEEISAQDEAPKPVDEVSDTSGMANEATTDADTTPATVTPTASEYKPAESVESTEAPTGVAADPQPTVPSDTNVSGPATVAAMAPIAGATGKKGGKKALAGIIVGIIIVLLAATGAGAYFGFYLPSKPENIWQSAMENSGKIYDEATKYATKERSQKAMKLEGSYDVDGAVESDGKITGESAGLNNKASGEFSAAGVKVGFDVRSIKATDKAPDLYFKLTGVQGLDSLLGGGQMEQALNGLNDQWYVIDHTLIEQATAGASEEEMKYSKQDVATLLEKASGPTKQYLLSADQQKAVFVVKQQIGSEQKDGRNTYHYKVGYNNANFGKYIEALCGAIKDDKLGKLIMSRERNKDCAAMGKEAAEQKTDDTADVWVDKRTKLPHVIRVADTKNSDNWVEFGQDYQGGDEFPMSVLFHGNKSGKTTEVNVKSVVNKKTDVVKLNGTFSVKGGSSKDSSGKLALTLTPTDEASVKVDKPANAKSFMELLNSLGMGGLISDYQNVQNKAQAVQQAPTGVRRSL